MPSTAAFFQAATIVRWTPVEAYRLRDEFDARKGWTGALRDARIAKLEGIIPSHALARISVGMRNQDYMDRIR